ncbi:MAG: hypothetical protein HYY25_07005 [Candidatus Wallbacteria bacterium]|nr:hypothetical protein [Candidatus Wallbacteria bacterium]
MVRNRTAPVALLALFAAGAVSVWSAEPAPATVEAGFRRLWERPGLLLDAGLNRPPPGEGPVVLRALEFTARSSRLVSVAWTPAASGGSDGPVRGTLAARVAGVMPPSTRTLEIDLVAVGLGLDREALRTRGAIRLVEPGRYRATSRLPFDLMELLNKGTRLGEEGGALVASGRRKVLLFELPFRLEGPLAAVDRVHVTLAPTQLSLASIPAPGPIRNALVDAVNPVFCIDAALGPLRHLLFAEVDSVRVEPTAVAVTVAGHPRLPGDPEPGPPHHPPRQR